FWVWEAEGGGDERYNQAMKFLKETEFEGYNCKIVKNENNEIEIVTKNAFGEIIRISSNELEIDWQKWKKIHPNFNERMVKEDIKKLTSEQVLNYGDVGELKQDYENSLIFNEEEIERSPEKIKKIKELGKSNNPTEFLESDYWEIYEEEAEELERLEEEKENLGTDQTQISYDLMRPDLAILWRKHQGKGILEQGPVIKEDSPNPDGTPKNLMQSNRMHYDFCSNLGIKRIYQSEFSSYQPRFSLFRAFPVGKKNVANNPDINNNPFWAVKKERGENTEGKSMDIPTDIYLTQLASHEEITDGKIMTKTTNIQNGAGNIIEQEGYNVNIDPQAEFNQVLNDILGGKIFLTVGPREHADGISFYSNLENKRELLFKENTGTEKEQKAARTYKKWLKNQPHL
ncbi:1192_t:CDS:2, partial [Funneliformis geosporum]